MTAVVGEWADQAECLGMDPELFHPGRGDDTSVSNAKAVCAVCPVRAECLDHAMTHGEKHGIWGGTSERERRRMRRGLPATPTGDRRRAPHGTTSAYRYHTRHGETACDACKQAHSRAVSKAAMARQASVKVAAGAAVIDIEELRRRAAAYAEAGRA